MVDKKKDTKKNNLVGKQFGDYKLIEALAVGGMSQIYKGEDINLGRVVAVKVLTPELLELDNTLVERFQREAKAVAGLEHENIITIYQYGQQDEHYFLTMKLIQGEDLADVLNSYQRKGQLMSPQRMIHILAQVASALDHAHHANIIHRDVKPSNILIDKSDKATLTDFGLVLRNDNLDQTMGTAFGTPRYISPEQALASERAVPQSDIYSLAVIVYEILTGEMIYKADTAMGFALSHISEPPPPPRSINPEIPRAVERELLKALDKIPERRHETATQFIEAIKESYGKDIPDTDLPELPPQKGTSTPVMAPPELRKKVDIASQPRKEQKPPDTWTLTRGEATPVVVPEKQTKVEDSPTLLEKDAKPSEKKKEKREKRKRRRTWGNLIGGILSAIIFTGAIYAGFMLSDLSDSFEGDRAQALILPTNTPEVVDIQTLPEGGEEIVIHYNFNAIIFYNNGEDTLNLTNLNIEGPNDTYFTNATRFTTVRLPVNECILIKDDQPNSSAPDDADCSFIATTITLSNNNVFWRGDNTTFSIQWHDIEITTCDAIGRNDSGTCSFIWPDLEG